MLSFFYLFFSSVLALIFLFISVFFSLKSEINMEKPSPFECGFFFSEFSWNPFCVHFFMCALIFLIFDIELVIMFPYLMSSDWSFSMIGVLFMLLFFFFLSLGFILEWGEGMLEWSY